MTTAIINLSTAMLVFLLGFRYSKGVYDYDLASGMPGAIKVLLPFLFCCVIFGANISFGLQAILTSSLP